MTARRTFLAAAVGAAFALAAGAVQAQTKWDMPTPYPDSNFHTKNVRQFADEVAKGTGGKLQITVHPANSLVKMAEMKRAVQTGQVPIGEMLMSVLVQRGGGLRVRLHPLSRRQLREAAQARTPPRSRSSRSASSAGHDDAVLRALAAAGRSTPRRTSTASPT